MKNKTVVLIASIVLLFPLWFMVLECMLEGYEDSTLQNLVDEK